MHGAKLDVTGRVPEMSLSANSGMD